MQTQRLPGGVSSCAFELCRSYPRLEATLDWLLAIYKFVFPFLVRGRVAGLSVGQGDVDGWMEGVLLLCRCIVGLRQYQLLVRCS